MIARHSAAGRAQRAVASNILILQRSPERFASLQRALRVGRILGRGDGYGGS